MDSVLSEPEFVRRFKKELRNLLGTNYDPGHASTAAKEYYWSSWFSGTPEEGAEWEASEHDKGRAA